MNFNTYKIPDLKNKNIIITGGASGIGLYSATQFCKQGANVIIASRDKKKGDKAVKQVKKELGKDTNITFMQLDLMSFKSIDNFALKVKSSIKSLDVLVNNAGVIFQSSKSLTEEGFDPHIATNTLGHFLLTNKLFELLKASKSSKIVNITSMAEKQNFFSVDRFGSHGISSWVNYSYSKTANIMLTYRLAELMKKAKINNVKALVCHPGLTASNSTQMNKINTFLINKTAMPLSKGTLPLIIASTSDKIASGKMIGFDGFLSLRGNIIREESSKITYDKEIQSDLFEKCEELTNCKFEF